MTAASPQPGNSQLHCLVLMLDDHEDTREMYATFLEQNGHFTVESEIAPSEAFEWVRRARPAVVVTDFRMPGLNGLELCEQLAADPETRDIPRVLLTGVTSDAELEPLRQLCAAVLVKPVFPDQLIAEIHRVTAHECGREST